jgi:hypothetical protein
MRYSFQQACTGIRDEEGFIHHFVQVQKTHTDVRSELDVIGIAAVVDKSSKTLSKTIAIHATIKRSASKVKLSDGLEGFAKLAFIKRNLGLEAPFVRYVHRANERAQHHA